MIALGLMSGTSLDGIDAALVEITPSRDTYEIDLRRFITVPFEAPLLQELHAMLPPNSGSVAALARAHHSVGAAFAQAAACVMRGGHVDYAASHGQTVWHDGAAHVTLQIGDAFVIRERIRASVCFDFRSADCAAGGHGAPLVPYVDALLAGSTQEDRVAVNIGGIANLTVMAKNARPMDVLAFDSGPGNMLIDALVRERTENRRSFDSDGRLALTGSVDHHALTMLTADPYFSRTPPKTAGREQFGAQFLQAHAAVLEPLSLEDAAATLTELSAATIADAIRSSAPAGARVLLSGGGARNPALVAALKRRLAGFTLDSSAAANLDPDAKEAIAFAVLGYETLRERAANIPAVTGALHRAVLGAIAPYDLDGLLEKVKTECRASS